MKTTTITPEEFEKAVARACMRAINAWAIIDPLRHGDKTAVLIGPHLRDIAREAGISIPQTRRRMQKLMEAGKVLRHDTSGGSTCWWLIGLAEAPGNTATAVKQAAPMTIMLSATTPEQKASIDALRQAVTPARQHWSDVLGVARDCSTSEAREAFQSALAAVDDLDLDAEQQRRRIRDAYNARLVEDGISE
ncbi:winged helix-turn-helix domain-containing protein [Luteibacter yeojuensis]|uniref:Winged helix-turn-helix domain-containing protein n=1 Tax=Luteibacter yeojuensis TaxID=345309 RepID=A0A7X5QU27_9GAMM|nr:winged helix-turn-helix domain-containing protein [Luteibacter yeojuensis]NID15426.1 winged helix-turn-helix domain-containing protein [Luteibacter yeojuensis]